MRWYVVVCAVLATAHAALPDSLAKVSVYIALSAAPAAAILVALRRHRPVRTLPWLLLAASQGFFVAGNAVLYGGEYLFQAAPSMPSMVDACYLAFYPLLAGGMLVLVRRRVPGGDTAALLDGLIVTVALGLVSWVFLVEPTLSAARDDWVACAVAVAYPLGDILILAVGIRLGQDRARRGPAFVLLVGGLVPLIVGDTLYAVRNLAGSWAPGGLEELGWLAFYVCLGSAALHPSMRELDAPVPVDRGKITPVRFGLLLAIAALLVPTVIAVQAARGEPVAVPVVTCFAALIFGLVLLRMRGLIRAMHLVHQNRSSTRFGWLTRHSSDVILMCDPGGTVLYVTPSVERVLGWRPEAVQGRPLREFMPPDDASRMSAMLAVVTAGGPVTPGALRGHLRTPAGIQVAVEMVATLVDDGDQRGVLLTTRDITEQIRLEQELSHQAFHDSLTGLANRALFLERLRHGLERRSQIFRHLAVLLLDLDDFKTVNDSLGPAAGDELLRLVAERLRGCLRSADTAARLGGDEFALLLEDIADPEEAAHVATRVLAELQEPFVVLGREVVVHASVGIAVVDPDTVPDADELLRNADVAMYTAKQQGKDRYDFFAPSMHTGLVRRLDLTAELRDAVRRREMEVYYQPIVSLPDGGLVGLEALVRWPHPTRGLISPAEFIPLAEDTGLIIPLGAEVLRQACAQVAQWRLARPELELSISVNLSPRQVQDPAVVELVRDTLATTGLPPHALTLEITESVLTEEAHVAVDRLVALKELGVRLAVDDFGTGYSSLSRLHNLPIDILKIPKPFVDDVTAGPTASALARAIVELSAALGLSVVAEGIEHPEQAMLLHELGCRLGQGYHFSRPVPAAELEAVLAAIGELAARRVA